MMKSLTLCLVLFQAFTLSLMYAQPIGPDFTDESSGYLKKLHANDSFTLVDGYEEITFSMAKSPWEGITFELANLEPVLNPAMSFKMYSKQPLEIQIDFLDKNHEIIPDLRFLKQVPGGKFSEITASLSRTFQVISPGADPEGELVEFPAYAILYVQPGKRFNGDINVKDFYLGSIDLHAVSLASESLKVFPNPAKNLLNVDLPEDGFSELMIYDIAGKVQLTSPIEITNSNLLHVDVSNLPPGIFYLSIVGRDKSKTQKIVIK